MASGPVAVNTLAPKFKIETYKSILAKQSDEEFQHAALQLIEDQSLKNKEDGKVSVPSRDSARAACIAYLFVNDTGCQRRRAPESTTDVKAGVTLQGDAFVKYGRNGKQMKTEVFLNPARDKICWVATGMGSMFQRNGVSLAHIIRVQTGQKTTNFLKHVTSLAGKVEKDADKRSFSGKKKTKCTLRGCHRRIHTRAVWCSFVPPCNACMCIYHDSIRFLQSSPRIDRWTW
jgi:hypothetical protein